MCREKNESERKEALKKQKIVQDYINNLHPNTIEPIKINFASRDDNECALYDVNRYNRRKIEEKLIDIFGE